MIDLAPDIRGLHPLVLAILLTIVAGSAVVVAQRFRLYRLSAHLRSLPGPKRLSWSLGSFKEPNDEIGSTRLHEAWVQEYGHVFKYYSGLGVRAEALLSTQDSLLPMQIVKVMIADPKAVAHILAQGPSYDKWEVHLGRVGTIIGQGA